MRSPSQQDEEASHRSAGAGFGAVSVVWLLFYAVLTIHGLATPRQERLAKAWAVQDDSEGEPGMAHLVRTSLLLGAPAERR